MSKCCIKLLMKPEVDELDCLKLASKVIDYLKSSGLMAKVSGVHLGHADRVGETTTISDTIN